MGVLHSAKSRGREVVRDQEQPQNAMYPMAEVFSFSRNLPVEMVLWHSNPLSVLCCMLCVGT